MCTYMYIYVESEFFDFGIGGISRQSRCDCEFAFYCIMKDISRRLI